MASTGLFRTTIFALSTGSLPSGVAIVRVSGPGARSALETMSGGVPPARRARHAAIRGRDGQELDHGLLLFFPGPASFTGEDCAEFHLHGGRAVVSAVLAELGSLDGFVPAEAGEFTRRAFVHGRVDLTAAEGLADLVAAETEGQRRAALANAEGLQAELYAGWRERIVRLRALVEAELDFADGGDVPDSASVQVWAEASVLATEVERHVVGFARAEMIRDGFRIVLLGAPNAGKSSLLNALARREAAIVTDEPGTTRDPVEVTMDLDGNRVVLTDTAGLREATGKVEQLGIARSYERAEEAHLVLYLEDLGGAPVEVPALAKPMLRIGTKADLRGGEQSGHERSISVVSGEGLDELLAELSQIVRERVGETGEALPSRRRHVALLERTAAALRCAVEMSDDPLELRAEELRVASDALGRITGAVDVEDLLDRIFSEFCIGK